MPAKRLSYSLELAKRMCTEIATGVSVKSLCEGESWACKESTFYLWLSQHDEFMEKYVRAKQSAMEVEAERILEIADTATPESVHVARLQIDARKWTAARLAPKRFGDKLAIGGDKGMDPIQTEEVSALEQINSRLSSLADRSGKGRSSSGPDGTTD